MAKQTRRGKPAREPSPKELQGQIDRALLSEGKAIDATPSSFHAPIYSGGAPQVPIGSIDAGGESGARLAPTRAIPEPIPHPSQQSPDEQAATYGVSGTPITSAFLYDLNEYNPKLVGRYAIPIWEQIRRDDMGWAVLDVCRRPVQTAQWRIVVKDVKKPITGATRGAVSSNGAGKATKGKTEEIRKFVEDNLMGGLETRTSTGGWATQSWASVIYNATLMQDFGCAIHEEVYHVDGNRITLRALQARQAMTFWRWHALALDTPVPTPSDWKTMESLKVGDEVFGPDGRIESVIGKSKVFKSRPCYKLTFKDGSSIIADADHQWKTQTYYERANPQCAKWRQEGQVRTTEEIYKTAKSTHGPCIANHSIQFCDPVQHRRKSLPIDPYVFGVWLGDGGSDSGYIASSVDDADEIKASCEAAGYSSRITPNGQQKGNARIVHTHGLWTKLKQLGVTGQKYIPREYLNGSIDQRRALLGGLMDSDGCVSRDPHYTGACRFTNCNKTLIDGVAELVRSLGEMANVNGPFDRGHQLYWVVNFNPVICPFRLGRKVQSYLAARPVGERKYHRHYIISVEPVEPKDTVCIAVTGDSHLFLAGKSFIPTHNTQADGETLYALEQYGYRGNAFLNVTLPCERFCRFTSRQEGANFFGIPLTRPLYGPWFYKDRLKRIGAVGAERNIMGVPTWRLTTKDATDRTAAENFVTSVVAHEATGVVEPPLPQGSTDKDSGFRFVTCNSAGENLRSLLQWVSYYDICMARAALAMFLTSGSTPFGNKSTAKEHADFFMLAVQNIADQIAWEIQMNTVRRLVWYNFGTDAPMPELQVANVQARQIEDFAQLISQLAMAGAFVSDQGSRDFIREMMALPKETREGLVAIKGETIDAGTPGGPSVEGRSAQPISGNGQQDQPQPKNKPLFHPLPTQGAEMIRSLKIGEQFKLTSPVMFTERMTPGPCLVVVGALSDNGWGKPQYLKGRFMVRQSHDDGGYIVADQLSTEV